MTSMSSRGLVCTQSTQKLVHPLVFLHEMIAEVFLSSIGTCWDHMRFHPEDHILFHPEIRI